MIKKKKEFCPSLVEETGTRNIFSKEFISTGETKGDRNSRETMSSTVAEQKKKQCIITCFLTF